MSLYSISMIPVDQTELDLFMIRGNVRKRQLKFNLKFNLKFRSFLEFVQMVGTTGSRKQCVLILTKSARKSVRLNY